MFDAKIDARTGTRPVLRALVKFNLGTRKFPDDCLQTAGSQERILALVGDRCGEVGSELRALDFCEGDTRADDEDDHGENSDANSDNGVDVFACAGSRALLGPMFLADPARGEVPTDEELNDRDDEDGDEDVGDETDERGEE